MVLLKLTRVLRLYRCLMEMVDKLTGGVTMLSKYMTFGFLCMFTIVFLSVPAYAQSSLVTNLNTLSAQTMLTNIQNNLPDLTKMVTAFAFVIGMAMVIMGIMQLKHVGEMRMQMSHEHHLGKPLLMIAMGTMLIYLPSAVQVGMSTFWSTPNPYGYNLQSDQWQQTINVCIAIVQFIGIVSFIRGLILLSHASGGHQQNAFMKGLMHVIGGIFCINIYQFVQVILGTLGIQT